MRSIPLGKFATRRLLCTKCNHYSSGWIDSGYGCGYRNTQMILSSIREDHLLAPIIFNNSRDFTSIHQFKLFSCNKYISKIIKTFHRLVKSNSLSKTHGETDSTWWVKLNWAESCIRQPNGSVLRTSQPCFYPFI